MHTAVQTFGALLSELIAESGQSAESICRQMGIKSQTTLKRMMRDESSTKRTTAFLGDFTRINPLDLDEEAFERLREALRVKLLGYDDYVINRSMYAFFQAPPLAPPALCQKAFGGTPMTLTTLFASYADYAQVDVQVMHCLFDSAIDALVQLLKQLEGPVLRVTQYISEETSPAKGIFHFFNLLDIMNHPRYQAFWMSRDRGGTQFGNCIFVNKTTQDGERLFDCICFTSNQSFMLLLDVRAIGVCAFYEDLCLFLRKQHEPFKTMVRCFKQMRPFIERTNELLLQERKQEEIEMKADFSLKCLPASLLENPLRSFSGGASEAEQKEFLERHGKRYQAFCERKCPYLGLFTEEGARRFVERGRMDSWADELCRLRPNEIRMVLKNLIDLPARNPNIRFRLLKTKVRHWDYAYQLFGETELSLTDNKPVDAHHYYICSITTDYIVKGFSNFVRQELLPHHTHSTEKTQDFLRSLLAALPADIKEE